MKVGARHPLAVGQSVGRQSARGPCQPGRVSRIFSLIFSEHRPAMYRTEDDYYDRLVVSFEPRSQAIGLVVPEAASGDFPDDRVMMPSPSPQRFAELLLLNQR